MPEQELRVKVNCDTLLEPVAEYRLYRRGDCFITGLHEAVRAVCDSSTPYLVVTPKEPEVSEPKYTIPVEVSKEVYEKYSGAKHIALTANGGSTIARLTPRVQPYEFPQELRVPGVHSIAANSSWTWWIYSSEPTLAGSYYWHSGKSKAARWADIQHLFPTVQMPTPEQCNNDWKQSLFVNPDFGKGE